MDLVTGALGKLPTKLLELLKDEYRLQTGVKDRIRGLTRELESMHATLRKVAQVPPDIAQGLLQLALAAEEVHADVLELGRAAYLLGRLAASQDVASASP